MTGRAVAREELTELFVTASRALVGIAVRSVESARVPLTVVQHRVLVLLAAEGGLTVGGIARLAGVNQSNASRVVDRLQKLGLVDRHRVEDDRRVVQVKLSRRGKGVVDSVSEVRRREIAAVLERLSDVDSRQLVTALAAFNAAAHEPDERDWPAAAR
jgi:DNA-binding MarR family transcriptional regulator